MAYSVVAATAAAAISGARAAPATNTGADVIFKGGKIIPVPGAAPVKALGIGGGKILALGSESSVDGLKSKNTKIVDLEGRVLMPGFVDPHNHTVLSALIFELLTDVGYTKFNTRGKLLNELRAFAMRTPPGQWILCSNFDNLLQGGDLSREELDGISTNHPIFVWYTNGHDACVNSLALKVTNIPDNIGTVPGGGHFGRDEKGQLNGLIYEESAMKKVLLPALPKITPQLAAKAVSDYLRSVAAVGNTTVHEPGTLRSLRRVMPTRRAAYVSHKPFGRRFRAIEFLAHFPSCAGGKALPRACIIPGRRSFSKPANGASPATRSGRRRPATSGICAGSSNLMLAITTRSVPIER